MPLKLIYLVLNYSLDQKLKYLKTSYFIIKQWTEAFDLSIHS